VGGRVKPGHDEDETYFPNAKSMLKEERMEETILIERHATWHKLTLNRPDKLNAVDEPMLATLREALEAAAADPACRAVLLTGAGRGFCAGQELGPSVLPGPNGPPDLAKLAHENHHRVVRTIRALPIPVVAAVNGVAAGAGAGFAMACDIVLAARSASFMQAFVRIGLVPDSGSSYFLPRLVGEARARALAMLGVPVSAEQAEAWGMIWRAVDDAALMPEAEKLVGQLAAGPAAALAATKRLLEVSLDSDLDTQLDRERDAQGEAGASADFAEGVAAFLGKRRPAFGPRG
jgi:2-(1,2-epoxy-1,2-dihydrophenyl)acetyl-CoA isomerase